MKVDGVSKLNHSVYSIINTMFLCHICMMMRMTRSTFLLLIDLARFLTQRLKGEGEWILLFTHLSHF